MTAPLPVAIIGAGFGGLCMAIRLKEAGVRFALFEAADDIGGTWRDNTYPGCGCDVPSHLYCFSFRLNPDWSRAYSGQEEILAYLRGCVDAYGLWDDIRLRTPVVELAFDDGAGLWRLTTATGEVVVARVVVTATGPLRVPRMPSPEGLDRFEGAAFHSARWDHGVALEGKRVAVIGTGASAIQLVPRLAAQVAQLHLLQRTPPWVIPKDDQVYSAADHARWRRHPWRMRGRRWAIYLNQEIRAVGFVQSPAVLRALQRLARLHIRRSIRDPALREVVTPRYTMGCKRILPSNDYYPALERDNVEVIPHALARVTERTVVAADGRERSVDAIVFATGFEVGALLSPLRVIGRGGLGLDEAWQRGVEAYFGLAVAGFPNLFLLAGPNTGLGHNSLVYMIEAQVHYVMQALAAMRARDWRTVEVRPESQRLFNVTLRERLKRTVWSSGCESWYLDAGGHNFTLWPGYTFEYWLRTRRVDWSCYDVA